MTTSCVSLISRIAATVALLVSDKSSVPAFCLVSISATISVADSSAVSFRTSVVMVLSPRSIVVAAPEPAVVTAVSMVSTSSCVTVAVIMAARSAGD